ncbi:hypothetical protein [Ktedonobacter robiniae]|uniref:hypothetical protein n=1 Tax=Ktedonobacter robiniae TaxID=2778365 RepID=UPI0019164193|nr:hypothetical protein [Ktedonobacter robiniae]
MKHMKRLAVILVLVCALTAVSFATAPLTHAASTPAHVQHGAAQVHPLINSVSCGTRTDFLKVQTQGPAYCYANAGYIPATIYGVEYICFGHNHGYVWYYGDPTAYYFGWGECAYYDRATVVALQIL